MSVGGSATLQVPGSVPAVSAPVAGSSLSAAPLGLGNFMDDLVLSKTFDADRYIYETEFFSSPSPSNFDEYSMAGDDTETLHFPANPENFFDEFINPDVSNAANSNEQQPQQQSGFCATTNASVHNLTYPNASEDPYQQPHTGASLNGCDDGGIAVGCI